MFIASLQLSFKNTLMETRLSMLFTVFTVVGGCLASSQTTSSTTSAILDMLDDMVLVTVSTMALVMVAWLCVMAV